MTSCTVLDAPGNGPYEASIADGLHPVRSTDDVVARSRAYLAQQTPLIAAPELHVAPHIAQVWAVRASDARHLDGCIPVQADDDIVWVTKGFGDYLNLQDLPWSHGTTPTDDPKIIACEGPGAAGTIVIDDSSGEILGVFPFIGDAYPHPSGQ